MTEHLSPDDLELYVTGGLEGVRAAVVEAHVVDCDACSAALANEAALEIAFEQIARASVTRGDATHLSPALRRRRDAQSPPRLGLAVVAAGTLSLAAAWLVFAPTTRDAARTGRASGSRVVVGPAYPAVGGDATAALDGRPPDPLDGG